MASTEQLLDRVLKAAMSPPLGLESLAFPGGRPHLLSQENRSIWSEQEYRVWSQQSRGFRLFFL